MKFLEVEIDEIIFRRLVITALILIVLYMAISMSSILILKNYTLGPDTSANDEGINTKVDSLEGIGSKKIEITGWAYREGDKIETINSNFVLKNQDTDQMYLMKTVMEKKDTLEGTGYENCGLHAQCLTLGLPKGRYQIYILYRNNNEDILADTLIPFEIK